MNKTFAVFANGGTMTTAQTALWQYDYGQILVVQGIELPTAYEVQFCNAGDSTTITSVGDSTGVVIPDQFLQNGETIYAYIYLHTGNADGETEYKITIPVMDRAEPTDIEPTPAQESTIGQLIDALNAGVEAAEEAAEKGPQIINGFWYTWDADAGEYVNTDVPAAGENGEDGNSIWRADVAPTPETVFGHTRYYYTASDLSGAAGRTVQQGDLIVKEADVLYYVRGIWESRYEVYRIGSIKGDPGEDGYSPVVTITEIDGGHRVTITDETHPQGQSFDVMDGQGGSGSSDYNDLSNKPQIAGVTLSGNKSLADLGIAAASDIPTVPVQSVNGKTGTVVLNASDVGAGTYTKPSSGIPKTDLASAVQTSLGKADTALQSAPVTSVNGQTGAVSLSIPTTASDVGAVASNQGASNANKVLTVNSSGVVVPEDNRFVVTLTPTAQDYSGTMDKTVAEIEDAWAAGKRIVFKVVTGANSAYYVDCTMRNDYNSQSAYPYYGAYIIDDVTDTIICAFAGGGSDPNDNTYFTHIYPLASGQWTGGSY